jgi:hypothetical protein
MLWLLLACTPDTPKDTGAVDAPAAPAFTRIDDDGLGPVAEAAIARLPAWLRADFALALRGVDTDRAEELAAVIVDLDDPELLDEAGFALAHLSQDVLKSQKFYPEVVVENARRIYEADPMLDYVELVESGTAGADDDWTTTTRYRVEVDGVVEEQTLDPELYYWFVVHPRIEDENPWYIDAWDECTRSTLECAADPETGTFWRSFLWEEAATTCPEGEVCPVVPEYLGGMDVLWGAADGADAVHAIASMLLASPGEQGRWFNFGAYGERSIQPNRIYALGRGNCGEWADMTTAIARTALIPNVNVTPASWDHTWNAVYVDRWIAYEPVNWWFDYPYGASYTTYATKGDASMFFQTELYMAETATLEIEVQDSEGAPVDGASVVLWTPYDTSWWYGGELVSGADGVARFTVQADKEIGFLVTSDLGEYPGNNTLDRATTGLPVGTTDRVTVTLDDAGPVAPTPSEASAGGTESLTVSIAAEGRSEGLSLRFDDQAIAETEAPPLSTWVMSEADYESFAAGGEFTALTGDLDPAQTYVVVIGNLSRGSTGAVGTVAIDFRGVTSTQLLALPAGAHLAVRVEPGE